MRHHRLQALAATSVRIAFVIVAASIALFVWSLRVATHLAPLPRPHAAVATAPVRAPAPAAETPDEATDDAVEADPFQPGRERPAVRYAAPGTATLASSITAPPPAAALHLVGTVVDGDNDSFVICQLGTAAARLVHVGEQLGGYHLRSITQGTAVFVSEGGERLELHVPRSGT